MDTTREVDRGEEPRRDRVRVRVRARRRRRRHRRGRRVAQLLLLVMAALALVGLLALFPAISARTHLLQARESMVEARAALAEGRSDDARTAFDQAHAQLLLARERIHNPLIQFVGLLPLAGRSPDATEALVEAGLRVTEAGQTITQAVEDLPGGVSALAPDDGRIPLRPIRDLAGPLGKAHRLLDEAGALMDQAPGSLLIPPVRDAVAEFRPLLDEARRGIGAAAALSGVLPDFLGGTGPRRYFVAAQNPAELRGTGGLIGSYSILTIRKGHLNFADFRPVSELDTVPPGTVEPPNPDYAAVWDRFSSRGYWSNINMTPDFPSAAVAIERLYEETEGVHLDGVIATDPFALAALLKVVGPVQVPGTGVTLDADNTVDYLTNGAYTTLPGRGRKLVLGDAAEEILGIFIGGPVGEKSEIPGPGAERGGGTTGVDRSGGRSGERPGTVAGTGDTEPGTGTVGSGEVQGDGHAAKGPAIKGNTGAIAFGQVLVEIAGDGHLLLHSAEPRDQRAFVAAGVAGGLPRQGGDFLGVVANAGSGTKLDYYLKRTVAYEVVLGDDGAAHAEATVKLKNDAPDHGEPPYVIGPNPFTDNEPGENFLYMSAYCAESCSLAEFRRDGRPDGVAPQEELGHPLFQATAQIPSGDAERLAFEWGVMRAWTGGSGGGTYRLIVDGQQGIRPMRLSLTIRVPDGMHVTSTTPGMKVSGDRVLWEGVAGDRMVFEVSFQRGLLGRVWHGLVDFLGQPVFRLG